MPEKPKRSALNQLTRTLLRKYDCGVRPVHNWTSLTTIHIDLVLQSVLAVVRKLWRLSATIPLLLDFRFFFTPQRSYLFIYLWYPLVITSITTILPGVIMRDKEKLDQHHLDSLQYLINKYDIKLVWNMKEFFNLLAIQKSQAYETCIWTIDDTDKKSKALLVSQRFLYVLCIYFCIFWYLCWYNGFVCMLCGKLSCSTVSSSRQVPNEVNSSHLNQKYY